MRAQRQKPSIRKLQEKRTHARCRNRAFEDSGVDELDEWMGGLPGGRRATIRWLGFLFLRDLGTLLARLGKPNRDRLFAALHLLARAAAFERGGLSLLHRPLDFLGRAFRILTASSPSWPFASPIWWGHPYLNGTRTENGGKAKVLSNELPSA
jgi:hypothetical protein